MFENLNTTFIPKVAPSETAHKAVSVSNFKHFGILTSVAGVLLLASVLVGVFVYLNRLSVNGRIDNIHVELNKAKNEFDPAFLVDVNDLDARLEMAKLVIDKHRLVSPLFRAIQEKTLKTLQMDSFSFSKVQGTGGATGAPTSDVLMVRVRGLASSYQSIAQQSDVLDTIDLIESHSFTDFRLNEKGKVSYSLEIRIPEDRLYAIRLLTEAADQGLIASPTDDMASGTGTSVMTQ